jgi:LacI family transcriptional regulator, fructose operon transcriptional repressor
MVKIKDVAKEAGVSTATVSRVLAQKPYVTAEVQARVMAAVEKLGYRPNRVARSLRAQQSNTIGLIVSDIRNPYFTYVSRAVEDTANEHGYAVFLCNSDEDPDKEALYLNLLRDENVSGLILSPTKQTSDDFSAINLNIPTVIVDRAIRHGDVDTVMIDNADAAYRLTCHLIENGYRRIGALFGEASATGRERRQGFEKALREYDLTPVAMRYLPPRIQAGHEATAAILNAPDRPDAILATNSLLSAGALEAIRELNLSIPDDIALVGFDETTWSTLVQPTLTVIAQPTYEIGQTAMELLLKRIEQPDAPARQVILKGQLMARGSSAVRSVQSTLAVA